MIFSDVEYLHPSLTPYMYLVNVILQFFPLLLSLPNNVGAACTATCMDVVPPYHMHAKFVVPGPKGHGNEGGHGFHGKDEHLLESESPLRQVVPFYQGPQKGNEGHLFWPERPYKDVVSPVHYASKVWGTWGPGPRKEGWPCPPWWRSTSWGLWTPIRPSTIPAGFDRKFWPRWHE